MVPLYLWLYTRPTILTQWIAIRRRPVTVRLPARYAADKPDALSYYGRYVVAASTFSGRQWIDENKRRVSAG